MSGRPKSARKLAAWRLGLKAESICVWHLRLRGYVIVARRLRTPVGELDIVARRGRVLAVIEVKARATLDDAAAAISEHQRRRIERGAAWLVSGRPDLAAMDLRYDAMLIAPGHLPRHIAAAW